jgi:hypothetical protein
MRDGRVDVLRFASRHLDGTAVNVLCLLFEGGQGEALAGQVITSQCPGKLAAGAHQLDTNGAALPVIAPESRDLV